MNKCKWIPADVRYVAFNMTAKYKLKYIVLGTQIILASN